MKSVVIGGNSRNIGKTGLAVSIIAATRHLGWTAVKVTQFGHGICSRSGSPCGCAVSSPECPYEISVEDGLLPSTDTARMLSAGASEVLWIRVALGQLREAMPAIRHRLQGRGHVLLESNSILDHWRPDAFLVGSAVRRRRLQSERCTSCSIGRCVRIASGQAHYAGMEGIRPGSAELKTDFQGGSAYVLHAGDRGVHSWPDGWGPCGDPIGEAPLLEPNCFARPAASRWG